IGAVRPFEVVDHVVLGGANAGDQLGDRLRFSRFAIAFHRVEVWTLLREFLVGVGGEQRDARAEMVLANALGGAQRLHQLSKRAKLNYEDALGRLVFVSRRRRFAPRDHARSPEILIERARLALSSRAGGRLP